ncbi:MAG: hypothetical protein OXH41_01730 [Chloroflexi bacterium]|nr:hypothetical protein [Chloroflexota bacterium]
MKKNFISAIAGWKSAALLALVAMVAAVAFSGVLTSTNTAEAANVDLTSSATSVTAAPGDTVDIIIDGADFISVSVDSSSTASGGFGASGAQSIACSNGTPSCDTGTEDADSDPATPNTDIGGSIQVTLSIDSDSGEGFILLNIGQVGGTAAPETKVITVSKENQAGSVSVSSAAPSIAATVAIGDNVTGSDRTTLTARLMNAQEPAKPLNVAAPGGVKFDVDGPATLECPDGTASGQVCTRPTANLDPDGAGELPAADGYAQATLVATGRPGVVTVTVSVGAIEDTIEIIVYGSAASITAEADESSIEIGGSTFIVVTSSDAAGNPVTRQNYALKSQGGNVGPSEAAVPVVVSTVTNKDNAAPQGTLTALLGDIPACGDVTAVADDAGTEDVNEAVAASFGTDAAGKCVIHVSASSKAAGAKADTTRGTHTLTIAGPAADGSTDVSVEISVGGPPTTIEHDAPERVDALSEHTVTVTVLDDEGVRVGKQAAEVIAIGGALAGTITTDIQDDTTDGQASFSFLAPPGTGTISFLVRAGTLPNRTQQLIEVAVGEAPAEEPEGPAPTWNNELVSGQNLVVWNGEDGADPSAGAADGVTAIWSYNTGSGSWDGYFPSAADVPGGNTLGSLNNGQAYVVIVE